MNHNGIHAKILRFASICTLKQSKTSPKHKSYPFLSPILISIRSMGGQHAAVAEDDGIDQAWYAKTSGHLPPKEVRLSFIVRRLCKDAKAIYGLRSSQDSMEMSTLQKQQLFLFVCRGNQGEMREREMLQRANLFIISPCTCQICLIPNWERQG